MVISIIKFFLPYSPVVSGCVITLYMCIAGVSSALSWLDGSVWGRHGVWQYCDQRLHPNSPALEPTHTAPERKRESGGNRGGKDDRLGETFNDLATSQTEDFILYLSLGKGNAVSAAGCYSDPNRPCRPHPPPLSANRKHPCMGSWEGPQQVGGNLIF